MTQRTISMAAAVKEFARNQLEQSRYSNRQRAWHAMPRYSVFIGHGTVVNPDGSVALTTDPVENALTNEGQSNMLNVYLRGSTATATFRLMLLVNAGGGQGASAPAKTSAMTDVLTDGSGTQTATKVYEESGGGYSRQAIANANWGAPALNSGDEMSTAAQQTFGPASGAAWTGLGGSGDGSSAITYAALAGNGALATPADTTGTLVLYVALSASTIIAVGQSFLYTLNFKQT